MSAALIAAIADVEGLLAKASAEVGPHSWEDQTWHARNRAAQKAMGEELIAKHGARIRENCHGARVGMLGVAATSTSGVAGALRNWVRSARAKAGQS